MAKEKAKKTGPLALIIDDEESICDSLAGVLSDEGWRAAIAQALLHGLREPPQRVRLAPTARSELRA